LGEPRGAVCESCADHIDEQEPTRENRIVIAETLTSYYTCLMTLSIEETRPPVLSDARDRR
jgi:hypothetical protein